MDVNFNQLDTLCLIRKHPDSPFVARVAERLAVRVFTRAADLRPLCGLFLEAATNTHDYHAQPPTALYGVIVPGVEPMGKLGQDFLETLRQGEKVYGPMYGVKAWFGGDAVKNLDMITSVYTTFPKAMA